VAEAVRRCGEKSYDAITLDLLLPDGNGLDLVRVLRADTNHRDIKVVVVTVVTEPGAVAGFAVDDVLSKPLDTVALVASLRRHGITPEPTGRVWIVDDDRGSLELMLATLESLGYRGVCFSSAAAALENLATEQPIAVVLDLMMPEIDGFAFLERFRAVESCRAIPVIVWTVKDLSEHEYDRLRATAQAVVAKGSGAGAGIGDVLREVLHG
jgi:CheY-like chemotaxis protein